MSTPGTTPYSSQASERQSSASHVFAGGGEMGMLMGAFDWSKTPVGPVRAWPQSLKTAVRIILTSRYPMFVWWGRELINLYNDPYRAFLGIKHPQALGKSAREVWAEIWDQIGPRTDAVLVRGESTYDEALLLLMERHGYLEETYFTFSYSPLPDDEGKVCGLFCAVKEETRQVIGERRLRLLRDIAAATSTDRSPEQVCQSAARSLSRALRDLPFSLIYLLGADGKTLFRAGESGIPADHAAAPDTISLADPSASAWPVDRVMQTGEIVVLDQLADRIHDVPQGEWSRPPYCAVLLPIANQGQARPAGVFVAGLNPYRKFDEDYRGFLSLLSNQIAGAIANAVAYETERKRAESLAEIDRVKTTFFSNVSHEFRTPLTLMLGPLEEVLPEAQERLSPERLEQLKAARRNALRLLKLVNTLLDFSRLEAHRMQAVFEPTDIARATAEIASVFRSALEKAGLRYTVDCGEISEPVYVDRDMWEKVVLNLLSNAFKFTFEGEVRLSLRQVNQSVELEVRDSGVGIPENELPHVFERFHRVEHTRARTHEGTGIGLSLVQELVKLHGGMVTVTSVVGQGSTFKVSIPCGNAHLPAERIHAKRTNRSSTALFQPFVEEGERWLPEQQAAEVGESFPAQEPTTGAREPGAAAGQKHVIVIADDNADMRGYLRHLLQREYEVHVVSDGEQALEAVKQLRPTLVLADVMMPRLSGFEVLQAIRNDPEVASTPVVLLSARAGEESRVEGLQAGADDYLVKPFTARELLARVATQVKMVALRRQSTERESRLRAAAELERRRLQEVLEQAPAAIGLMSGPEHRWTYVNEFYVRTTGRKSAADFLGKTVRESLPELESQGFIKLLDEVYQSGEAFVGREQKVLLNRAASGQPEEAYYDFIYQPLRNAEGQVEAVLVHAVEVTDQVLAREVIRQSEERFRAIVETTPECVKVVAEDGTLLHMNSAGLAMVGAESPDQVIGESVYTLIAPEHRERFREFNQKVCSGQKASLEFDIVGLNGMRRHMDSHAAALRDSQGRNVQLAVTRDITERKLAEEEQQEREQEFQSLADAIPQLVWMATADGSIYWYNQRWYEYTGTKPEEMLGWGWQSVHDPATLPAVLERWKASLASGENFEMTFPLRGADGIFRPFLTRVVPVRGHGGKITRWFGTNTDVSPQARSERELKASQKRLNAALAASGTGTFRWNAETGEFVEFDENLKKLFGFASQMSVRFFEDFLARVHPDDLPRVMSAVTASQQGVDFDMEFRVVLPDGSVRWLYERARMDREDGKAGHFIGACTDITRRKQVEIAQYKLAAIVDSSDDAIVSKDLNGIVASWNASAEKMFGYTAKEMIGRSILTIIPPELHSDEDMILSKIRRGEKIDHFETVRLTKFGERIDVSLSISPVRDEHGNIIGAAKIARDVTENKKIERALRTTEKLATAGRMAATVAHEINNPLEAVTNLVYLAQRDLPDAAKVNRYLDSAKSELDRIAHISRQTLGFYRDTSSPTRFDIGQSLNDLLFLYDRRIHLRKIAVMKQYHEGTEIDGFAGEIRQALSNLLTNAIDAMPNGGTLVIRVSESREWSNSQLHGIRVTVLDTGSGIAPEHKKNIFQPFFTTKADVGTGLGLWITRTIIEKHGGVIRYKSCSRPERHGTAFSVFLPLVLKTGGMRDTSNAAEAEVLNPSTGVKK